MKPSFDIPEEILDNESEFTQDFYKRFTLRHAPVPIKLENNIEKNYTFPTFYGDVTCAMAICFCNYKKAAQVVQKDLGPKVKPVSMGAGRSLVAFSNYKYKKVNGVRPYNEIAVAIPVMVNALISPPVLPMVMKTFSHFGYYIAHMPVTSHENTLRGHRIWGLPKVTQEIDIRQQGSDCVTTAMEEDGTPYLTIRVPMIGKPVDFDETGFLYTRHEGAMKRSQTNFKAKFNLTKNGKTLFYSKAKPDKTYIEIGETKSARMLKDLEIAPLPFQFRYAEHMTACFDLPDPDMPSWVQNL
ncbi:MAG: acetoacetate decarboxylase family protein [Desulfobacteraceae bacterium]|nr:acetoacetate decarboxylase family protein [Desulfobacteraceae bacterium]